MYKLTKQNLCDIRETKKRAELISEESFVPIDLIHSKDVDNWYEIDGKWYFYRGPLSEIHLTNELIGEEISKYFGLDSVHYQLATREGERGIVFENFCKPQFTYKKASEYGLRNQKDLEILKNTKEICRTKKEYKVLKRELKRLLIRDLYTSQKERTNQNLLFREGESIQLAPLFDYRYSFSKRNIGTYNGVLGNLVIDKKTKMKLQNDKDFNKYLFLILELDILDIISRVEDNHHIIVPEEAKDYYSDYDIKIKKLIS